MVEAVRIERVNDAQVVSTRGHVGQPVANPEPSFAVLSPLALAGHDRRVLLAHGQNHRLERSWERLARELFQFRLWIERIDVAGATFQKNEDDAFGFGREVGTRATGVGGGIAREKAGQRNRPETGAGLGEHVATGEVDRGHSFYAARS